MEGWRLKCGWLSLKSAHGTLLTLMVLIITTLYSAVTQFWKSVQQNRCWIPGALLLTNFRTVERITQPLSYTKICYRIALKPTTLTYPVLSCPVPYCPVASLLKTVQRTQGLQKPSIRMLRVDETYIEEFLHIRLRVRPSWGCSIWPATQQRPVDYNVMSTRYLSFTPHFAHPLPRTGS